MGVLIRISLIGLCLLLALVGEVDRQAVAALVALAVLTALGSRVPPTGTWAIGLRATETAIAAAAVVLGEGADSPLLLYVVAPAFAGGIAAGYPGGIAPGALYLCVFGPTTALDPPWAADLGVDVVLQWTVMPLAAGLIAGRLHRQLVQSSAAAHSRGYEEAYRLLAQLRVVARRLPVGLDPVTISEGLMQNLRAVTPYRAAAVLVRTGGSSLVPIASSGGPAATWQANLAEEGPFAEAWLTQLPQARRCREGALGAAAHQLVLPLRIGARTFGLVCLEQSDPVEPGGVGELQAMVDEVAVRLDTALLFDELRGFAVAEERRRLAREIHDGVAQEVASLGYLVDNLSGDTQEEHTRDGLLELRQELSRIVSELRLSIFDLRSEVTIQGGLGAALSDYVRAVGAQSPLVVHLELDETGERLPAQAEAELLRLAQEAVQNARRHSGASNIWVRCSVRPPQARLLVEDDGVGPGHAHRDGGYGMDIMRERAERLHATFSVQARQPRGTIVDVQVSPRHQPAVDDVPGRAPV